MKYKKIYLEITNICNLNCPFCPQTTRKLEFMTLDNFKTILTKIKGYTNYLYFHVMGEPLIHPLINEFIKIAHQEGFNINLTTNGYLINNLSDNIPLRQLNISLHSYNENNSLNLTTYLDNIFKKAQKLAENKTYINYRIWQENEISTILLQKLSNFYQLPLLTKEKNQKLTKNTFLSQEKAFIWPIKRGEEGSLFQKGHCLALKDHIAILVDGTIVPCCLDNDATINLGNILKSNLIDIINTPLYQNMFKNFQNNQKIHPLCQKCNFYDLKK